MGKQRPCYSLIKGQLQNSCNQTKSVEVVRVLLYISLIMSFDSLTVKSQRHYLFKV